MNPNQNTRTFVILIKGSPFDSSACTSALEFCKALINKHYTIKSIFFYQDAILCANHSINAPEGGVNINQVWSEFAKQHSLELLLCGASCERRGLMNIQNPFKLSGIAQLFSALHDTDKLISFG